MGGEGEGPDGFGLNETSDIAASVFRIKDILQPLLIAAEDSEKYGQRNYCDTADTTHYATDDRTNDRRRVCSFSKANLIVLGAIGVPDLDNSSDGV